MSFIKKIFKGNKEPKANERSQIFFDKKPKEAETGEGQGYRNVIIDGNNIRIEEGKKEIEHADENEEPVSSSSGFSSMGLISNFIANVISSKLIFSEAYVKNIISDLEKYPNCAEKTLLKLVYMCSLERLPHLKSNEKMANIADYDFKPIIQELNERLNLEELNTETVKELCQKINKSLEMKEFRSVLIQLKELLRLLRDINIQELFRLTASNEKHLELIKNKDIYMIMGLTGSGKTTTLHFLGGSKMERKMIDDKEEIVPKVVHNSYLKDVTSETKNITPVIIDLAGITLNS